MRQEHVFSDICREDIFIIFGNEPYKFIAPLFYLFSLTWIVQDDWKIQRILREQSRQRIWHRGVFKMGVASVLFNLLVVAAGGIVQWMFRRYPWNWDQDGSAFWLHTKGARPETTEIGTTEIIGWFIFIHVLFYFILALMFWGFYVWTRNLAFSMAAPLAVHVALPLSKRWSISWEYWVSNGVLEKKVLEEVLVCVALVVALHLLMRRQEFIDET